MLFDPYLSFHQPGPHQFHQTNQQHSVNSLLDVPADQRGRNFLATHYQARTASQDPEVSLLVPAQQVPLRSSSQSELKNIGTTMGQNYVSYY